MKKIFDIWGGALVTILISVPTIAAIIQITHEGAKITFVSNHGVVAVIILIGGYALIWKTFTTIDKVAGQLGDVAASATGKARKALSNYRGNTMKNRGKLWRQGALFENRGVGGRFNNVGRAIGAANSGDRFRASALVPGRVGRAARANYDEVLQHQAVEGSPMLKALQNDDTANAVLAGTGGVNTRAALERSARDLGLTDAAGNISGAGEAAIAKAQAVGVNRTTAMTALQTAMKNKARAFTPGNVRAVDNFVRRLANNEEEYQRMSNDVAYHARSNGRADLGGTDFISYNQNNATWQNARAVTAAAAAANPALTQDQLDNITWQNVSDSNATNGYGRVGIQAMVGGHDNQVLQSAETFIRTLQSAPAGSDARFLAAVNLKEMQGNIQGMSGTARDGFNNLLYNRLGVDFTSPVPVADQLAAMTGTGVNGAALTTVGRVWPEYSAGGVMPPPPPVTPPPPPVTPPPPPPPGGP